MDDHLFTLTRAAAYVGLPRRQLYRFARAGRLGKLVGGRWMFTREDLDFFLGLPKDERGRPTRWWRYTTVEEHVAAMMLHADAVRIEPGPDGGFVGRYIGYPVEAAPLSPPAG